MNRSLRQSPAGSLRGILLAMSLLSVFLPNLHAFTEAEPSVLERDLLIPPDASILVSPSLSPFFLSGNNPPSNPRILNFMTRFGAQWDVQWDLRSDRPDLISGQGIPLIPGPGNSLTLSDVTVLGKPIRTLDRTTMGELAIQFIEDQYDVLRVEPADLRLDELATETFGNNRLCFVVFNQVHRGIPVKHAQVFVRVNSGNITQFGAHRYFPVDPSLNPVPAIRAEKALEIATAHADRLAFGDLDIVDPPELLWIQTFAETDDLIPGEPFTGTPGQGYSHRLVWETRFRIDPNPETWFAVIDAQTGVILSFRNDNRTAAVSGGVYPVTNIDTEVNLPFAYASTSQGTATSGGRYTYTGGTASCTMNGQYVRISDNCGSISLSTSADPGDINFGGSAGQDCTTPGFGGSGNTHASRSCYFHVNDIKMKARGYLPSNSWLQQNMTANVNINDTCNAYWNGSTINFYRSGGGCSNTGEISSVFLHEWGHGLDDNTATGSPDMASAEALADIMSFLQTQVSCIGHNFQPGSPCSFGCDSTCTGVRDAGVRPFVRPSNITSAPANCDRWSCPYYGYDGIMGYEGHCEALIAAGAIWDAANKLATQMGGKAGWEHANRLFFETMGSAGAAYQIQSGGTCNPSATINGCGSANYYQTWIFADDDNGNLADGTPHGCELWNAFNDHGIACGTQPACYTTCPTISTPTLAVIPGDDSATVSWSSVPNASTYRIFRNTVGCNFGMTLIGTSSTTQYVDSSVANDFTYYYAVQAVGSNDACVSAFSTCQAVEITGCANPPLVDAGGNQETCPGQAVTIGGNPTASSGTPPFTYLWTPGNFSSSNPSVSPNQTTTYTVFVTDSIGCVGSDTVTVTIDSPPTNAGFDQFTCAGHCVQIGAAPVSGYTYQWSPTTGLDNPNIANPMACVSQTTTYTLTVNASGYLCQGRDTVVVTVAQPSLTFANADVISDSGDSDGSPESGERVQISITIRNSSPITAYDVTANLSSPDNLIHVVSSPQSLGDLSFNATASATFEFIVDMTHECPDLTSLTLIPSACGGPTGALLIPLQLGQSGGIETFYSTGFEGTSDEGWTHVQVATQDDWQRGSCTGTSEYDPSSAFEGVNVWGNDLGYEGYDGNYKNYVNNYLLSPVINCTGKSGVRLQFRRWLSVEEGIYDQATVYVNNEQIWQNAQNSDHVDTAWMPVDYDISAIADNNPSVQIKFELVSDGGVTFGGWNIDDFKLVSDSPPECDSFECSGPYANAGQDVTSPAGSAVVLNGSGSSIANCVAGIAYRWRGGELGAGTWSAGSTVTVYPTESTTYTLEIRCSGSPDYTGCSASDTMSVYMSGQPTPTAPPPTATFPPSTTTPTHVPPTFTPPPPPTATPTTAPGEPTNTPVPPTPTPTTMLPSPTPTSSSGGLSVNLLLSRTEFHAGDPFLLATQVDNSGAAILVDEYLLLEVYGNFWFYPSWQQDLDRMQRMIEPGQSVTTIFNFLWPQVDGQAEGILFHYILCQPQTYQLLSNYVYVEFSYR